MMIVEHFEGQLETYHMEFWYYRLVAGERKVLWNWADT